MSRIRNEAMLREMETGCYMNRARIVSRVVTSLYDDVLRPFGIRGSQLALLTAIGLMTPVRRSDLGKRLHIDASTLTRNLRVMQTNGWVADAADASDGRGAPVRITASGERLLADVAPAWRDAQRRAARLFGTGARDALVELSDALMSA